jgi:hypothetical protein
MFLFDFAAIARFLKRLGLGRRQSVTQPVPKVTPGDVERVVRRDFPDEPFANVMAILNEYGTEKWQREQPRVQLAMLKLAKGNLEKLRAAVNVAKSDYRDVLAPAEYPLYAKGSFRTGNLPVKERQRVIDSDWRQYEEWLRK